jgi:hypothetical protein
MQSAAVISFPLPLMGRGRGGVIIAVERCANITPSQPSPIEGEGFCGGPPPRSGED